MAESLRIWFLASEVAPFAKTGGLADVAGSLPGALKKLGMDVRVGLPYYRMVKEGGFSVRKVLEGLEVPLGDRVLRGNVLETTTEEGIPVYLFARDDLFDRPYLYSTPKGDYPDNLERFTYLSRAAILFAKQAGLDFDLIHCHDWQTGLIPAYLKTLYRADSFFSRAASVFTIHNLGYQGLFPQDKLPICGLPASEFHPEGLEYWGQISLLKAGIMYADAITTVSPRYSQEIQTPEFGLGMDGTLRKRSADLYGILNGADYHVWDPARDVHVPANYSPGKMAGKRRCKESLIQEMGLEPSLRKSPLLGMISRLDFQKGLDLLVQILDEVLALDVGLVVLGSGDERIQKAIQAAAERHPGHVGLEIDFNEPLAHRIMAGADMFLVPSRYEPCGLTQIYALKYGTVPIVRATGGLDDTIQAFDPKSGKGTGFKFVPYEPKALLDQIKKAVKTYHNGSAWGKVVKNGMKADFSWDESARKYVLLYKKVKKGNKMETRG
ncbi:MAG: glycogen synthase GlgA [Deltaproteobacteria bacterium]|mgnify:CR=1 FL=1|nr:glycogen synthase GlgA [Deltaproteobacteria bacterium]RLB81891.1 MAG: glycogen synthase GlgA [Deltaproteobacteria bacterium]